MFRELEDVTSYHMGPIEARPSPLHGLGVFSTDHISKHTLIEACPIMMIPYKDITDAMDALGIESDTERPDVLGYPWAWPDGLASYCLGYGSLYNHSFDPNVTHKRRPDPHETVLRNGTMGVGHLDKGTSGMTFRAKRDIVPGEELTVCYHQDPDRLWFKDNSTPEELAKGYQRRNVMYRDEAWDNSGIEGMFAPNNRLARRPIPSGETISGVTMYDRWSIENPRITDENNTNKNESKT